MEAAGCPRNFLRIYKATRCHIAERKLFYFILFYFKTVIRISVRNWSKFIYSL